MTHRTRKGAPSPRALVPKRNLQGEDVRLQFKESKQKFIRKLKEEHETKLGEKDEQFKLQERKFTSTIEQLENDLKTKYMNMMKKLNDEQDKIQDESRKKRKESDKKE